jgi:hypothetical protein
MDAMVDILHTNFLDCLKQKGGYIRNLFHKVKLPLNTKRERSCTGVQTKQNLIEFFYRFSTKSDVCEKSFLSFFPFSFLFRHGAKIYVHRVIQCALI